ncbi:putative RNA-directed DNA polymerase [Tanacetum coccineum]
MAKDDKIKIDKFDGHDFGFWKMQIKDYMYQKKLHGPLAEAKPTSMKAEDWTLLDRQALGAVRLSLAKNVAYNVVNEKTTYGLFKALSNMYEKPSASNKVFFIRQLVNTKMKEGVSVADHSGTITAVSGSTGSTKLKFNNIRDLILGEDIRRKTSGEYSNSLLSVEDKGRGRNQDKGKNQNRCRSKSKKRGQSKNRQDITCWNCNQKDHFQNQFLNPIASKDKEVHMAVRDYDDALVCCVENAVEDHIMDSDLSFHPTFCKEELEKFRLYTDKVRLVDDKSLDIAEVGDVVLKTSFDASWTLKDVSLVVARGNKRGSLYMVKIPCDGISGAIDGRGNATLWHQRLGRMSEKGMKILALKDRIRKIWEYKKTTDARASSYKCLWLTSVASIGGSRYYVTFINDSSMKKAAVENETNLRVKCLKSDNDREYISREFIEYYAKNGIRMLKTFSKTPQQNGV